MNQTTLYLLSKPEVPPNNPDNSANTRSNNYYPKPRYPWGIDPSYNPAYNPGGGSSSRYLITKFQKMMNGLVINMSGIKRKRTCSTSEEDKKIQPPGKLQVDLDFPYEYDDNGNPTLLVPNIGRARRKRPYTKVEFDQTASHMHHAPDLGIVLPQDFDMAKYRGSR